MDVSDCYTSSVNLHRFAFGGRNFEYYSEDGFLSAAMSVAEVAASVDNGISSTSP